MDRAVSELKGSRYANNKRNLLLNLELSVWMLNRMLRWMASVFEVSKKASALPNQGYSKMTCHACPRACERSFPESQEPRTLKCAVDSRQLRSGRNISLWNSATSAMQSPQPVSSLEKETGWTKHWTKPYQAAKFCYRSGAASKTKWLREGWDYKNV